MPDRSILNTDDATQSFRPLNKILSKPARASEGHRVPEPEPIMSGSEAHSYDQLMRRYGSLYTRSFIRQLLEATPDQARVLDIGSGPGYLPLALAERRPQWEIHAVDASADMVDMAQKRARAQNLAHQVHFQSGTACALPFPDNTFELVCSHYLLHHLDHPETMLREAYRVTAPGGWIAVKDLKRSGPWTRHLVLAFCRHVLRYSESQIKTSADSLEAAFTKQEIAATLADLKWPKATVRSSGPLEWILLVQKSSARSLRMHVSAEINVS